MILKDFINNSDSESSIFGDLIPLSTRDGSISFKNNYFNESYHSNSGALKEATEKFIRPANLESFQRNQQISILDVCFGLGYNTACFFENSIPLNNQIKWWGLEIDKRPLEIALKNNSFKKLWSAPVLEILENINMRKKWTNKNNEGELLLGNAISKIDDIPKTILFDLIFHDAFSPTKCPGLWTEEFLGKLANKLAPNGRLITYSSSAAIRGTLRRAGLKIYSTIPTTKKSKMWSIGTTAIFQEESDLLDQSIVKPLSKMEEDHLLTNASIPFRDPESNGNTKSILKRREEEQKNSVLISTASWRKYWHKQ